MKLTVKNLKTLKKDATPLQKSAFDYVLGEWSNYDNKVHSPKEDYCFIMDSNGKFNALWEFSAYVVEQGFEIIKAGKEEKFLDGNIPRAGVF